MSQQRATDLTCNETLPLDEEPRLSGAAHHPPVRRFQVASTPTQGPFRVNYPPGQAPPQQKTYTASQIARPVASRSYTVANPGPTRNVVGGSGIHNISGSSTTSTPIHRGFVAPNNVTRVIRPATQQSDHDHGPVTFTTHATHQVPIVRHPLDNRFDMHSARHSHTPQPVHQANLPSPFVNSLRLTQAPPAPPAGSKTAQGLLNVVQSMSRHNTSPSLSQFNQTLFGAQHFPQSTFGAGASTSRIVGASPIIPHPRFSAQNNGSNKVVQSTPGVVRFQTTTPAAPMSHIQTPAIQRVQTTTPHIMHGGSGGSFVHPSAALMGIAQSTVNTPSPRPSILRKPSTPGSAAKRKLGFGTDLPGTSTGTLLGASASPSMSSVRSIIQNTNDATNSVAKALGSVAAPVTNGTEGESPRKRPRKQQFDSSQHEPMMMAVGMEAIKTPIWELPRDHPMAQEYFRNMQMIPPEKKKRGRPRADATRSSATADQFMVQTGVRRVFVPMDQLPNQALSQIAQQQNQIINPGMTNPAAAAIAAAMEAAGLQNTFSTQASTSRTVVGGTLHNLNPHQTVKEALSQMAADKAKVDLERKTAEQVEAKARADALAQAQSSAQIEQMRAAVTASHAAKGAPAKGRPTAEKKKAAVAAAAASAAATLESKASTSKKESKETPAAKKKAPPKKKVAPKKAAVKTKTIVEKDVKDEAEEDVREKPKSPKKKKIIKKKKSVKGAAAKKVAAKKAPPKEMTIEEQETNALGYLTTLMRGNLKQKALLTKSEKVASMGLLKRYFPDKYRQVDEPALSIRNNGPKLAFQRYNSRWNHFNKIENLKKAYEDKKHARKIQKLNDNIRKKLRKQCKITAKNVTKQQDPKLRHFCRLNKLSVTELRSRKKFVKLLTKVFMDRIEAFVKKNYPYFRKKNEKQREAEADAAEKKQEEKEKQTEFAMKCIRLLKKRVRQGKVEKKFVGEGDSRTKVQTFSKNLDGCRYEFTASETRKKKPKSKKVRKTKKTPKIAVKQDNKNLKKCLIKLKSKAIAEKRAQPTEATGMDVDLKKNDSAYSSKVKAEPVKFFKNQKKPTSTKVVVTTVSKSSAMSSLVSALNAAGFASSSTAPGLSTSSATFGSSGSFDLPGPSTSKALSSASSASDAFCPKLLVSMAKYTAKDLKKPIKRRIIKVASQDEVVARLLADARCHSLSPAVKYVVATPEELKEDAAKKKRRLRMKVTAKRRGELSTLQQTADKDTLAGLQTALHEVTGREGTSTSAAVKPEVKDEPPSDESEVKQPVKEALSVEKPAATDDKPIKTAPPKANKVVTAKTVPIPASTPKAATLPSSNPVPSAAAKKVPTAAPKPKSAHRWIEIRPQEAAPPVVRSIRDNIKEAVGKYNSTLAKMPATSEKKDSTESAPVPPPAKKAKIALHPWQILRSKKLLKAMGMWKSKKTADNNSKKDSVKLSKPKKIRAVRRISLRTKTAKRLALDYLRDLRKEKLKVSALPKGTEKQRLIRKKRKECYNKKVTKFFVYLEKARTLRVVSKNKKSKKQNIKIKESRIFKKRLALRGRKAKKIGNSLKNVKKSRNVKPIAAGATAVPVAGTATNKKMEKTGKGKKKVLSKNKKDEKTKKVKITGKSPKTVVRKGMKAKKARVVKKSRYPLTRADRCAIEEVIDSLASAVSFDIDKDQKEREAFENRSALRKIKGCPIMSHGEKELKRVLQAQKSRHRMENYSFHKVFPSSPPRNEPNPEDLDFRSYNVSIPTDFERNKNWWTPVIGLPNKKHKNNMIRECKTRAERRHEKQLRLLKKLRIELKQNAKKATEQPAADVGKVGSLFVAPAEKPEKKLTFAAFKKLLAKMHPSKRFVILRKVKKRMFDVKMNLSQKRTEDKKKRRKAKKLKKKKEKKTKQKLKKLKKILRAKKKAARLAEAQAAEKKGEAKKEEESQGQETESSQRLDYEEGLAVPPVAMEVEVETTVAESPKKKAKGRATKPKKLPAKKGTNAAPAVDYREFLRPVDRELTFADIFDAADKEDEIEPKKLNVPTIKVVPAEKSTGKSKVSKEKKKTKSTLKDDKMKSKKAGKRKGSNKVVRKRVCLNPARRYLIRLYGRGNRYRGTKRYRRRIRKAKKTLKLAKEMTSKRNKERRAILKESKKYKLALEKAKWLRHGKGNKEAKKFLLQEWKRKLKSMKKVRKLKKKRREAKKKLKEKRKAQQKAHAEKLVKEQGMKPAAAKRQVKRTIRLPYTHPTAQDIAVMRLREYQENLLEQLDTDRKVLLMFEQYLKTWDPVSYNKLQKDIVRDYEPGDSSDMVYRKKLARLRVTLLRPQIELPPPKRPPHIESCDNVVVINPSKATMNSTFTSGSPFWEAPTCSKNDNNRRILRSGNVTSDRPDDWKPLDMTPRIIYPDEMAQWCTEEQRDIVLGNLDEVYEKYLARLGPDDPIDVPNPDPEEFEEKSVVQGVSRRTLRFKHKGNEEVTFLAEVNKPKLELVDETDSPMNRLKTKAHWAMNRELLATSYKDIYDTSCLMVQTMLHMKASLCPEEKPVEVAPAAPEPVPVVVEKKKPAPPPRAKKQQPKAGKKAQKQQKAAAQAKKDAAKKEPAKPRATPKHPRAPRTPVITESTFERQIRRAIQESLKSMPSTSRG